MPEARPPTDQQQRDDVEPFAVHTLDGVRVQGVHLPARQASSDAVVLCHGFLGSWRRPQNVELAEVLAQRFHVFLFDFRGHGASEGASTVGDREAIDVQAVCAFARKRGAERVVPVGASMGAIAVLREAARFADVDGVVSVSAPGRWSGHGRIARVAGVLVSTAAGRTFARLVFRTRVYPEWTWSPPPVDMIERIDAPVLLCHGTDDRFIPMAQAELLYARSRGRCRLVYLDGFGHAELGYTRGFGELLIAEIGGMLDDPAWGAAGDGLATRRMPAPGRS